MSANLMSILRQDGSICGGFPVKSNVNNIQDVTFDQDWKELLAKREHRIIDSIRLSDKIYPANHRFDPLILGLISLFCAFYAATLNSSDSFPLYFS